VRGERVEPCLVAVVHASHHGEAAVLAAAHQRHNLHRLRLRLTSLALSRSRVKLNLESVRVPRSPAAEMDSGHPVPQLCAAAKARGTGKSQRGGGAAQTRSHARWRGVGRRRGVRLSRSASSGLRQHPGAGLGLAYWAMNEKW